MAEVGQQVGNYRLVALLGSGSFAEVYLGQHIQVHNLYAAIKILNMRLSESYREGFRREAEIIAELRHPNIIRILDYGIDASDNSPYLAMDYAPQGTLRKRHPKGSSVPLETLLTYVKQIAAALQYAHDRNLIHRDLKPENLLVGENGEIVVSDFGIATVAHATSTLETSAYSGTATYSAPEQILGKSRVQSDQYALGIILYEWLTGDLPFHGSFPELCAQHLYAFPEPLHEKVRGIPGEVEEVIMTALAKDPHQRFGSIQVFAHAFEQAYALSSYPTLPAEKPVPSQPTRPGMIPIQKQEQVPPQGEIVSIQPQQSAVETPLSIHEETSEKHQEPVSSQGTPNEVKPEQVSAQKEVVSESQQSIVETAPPMHGVPSGEHVEPVPSQPTPVEVMPVSVADQPPLQTPVLAQQSQIRDTLPAPAPPDVSPSPGASVLPDVLGANRRIARRKMLVGLGLAGVGIAVTGIGIGWLELSHRSPGNTGPLSVGTTTTTHYITYRGHSGEVNSVVWSPDGKSIASGSGDKTVQVWDAANGTRKLTYRGHSGGVNSVAWSPDGKSIASGGSDYPDPTVQVWDAATGTRKLTYRGHSGEVNSVAWSPDGKSIASGGGDTTVQVWDAANGTRKLTYRDINRDIIRSISWLSVAWSPDGKSIASSGSDYPVQVWDAATGTRKLTYAGHAAISVNSVAWSPDGKSIASGGGDTTVQIWQAV